MLFTQAGMEETPPTEKNGAFGWMAPSPEPGGTLSPYNTAIKPALGHIHNQRALRTLREPLVGSTAEVIFWGKRTPIN